ncbi:hypothetical protein [Psychrobacillus vulpis]|nr:hypothetical protein [Psychrobacillus vulpis]
MSYPYIQFGNTPLWSVIKKGMKDFVENKDIQESTQREYIVG